MPGGLTKNTKQPIFRTPKRRAAFALFLVAVVVVLAISLAFVDGARVAVDRQLVEVPALPAAAEGFSTLLIGDLHGKTFGENHDLIINALEQTRVDAIVFAGDVCGPDGDAEAFFALIDRLLAHASTANKPIFILGGDEDPPASQFKGIDRVPGAWVEGAMERGAVLLDSPQLVTAGDARVWFSYGLSPILEIDESVASLSDELSMLIKQRDITKTEQEQRISELRYNLKILERTQEMRALMQPSDVQIGVLHHPLTDAFLDVLNTTQDENARNFRSLDVMLAAHYCGGGIRLPFVGALHVPAPTLPNGGWWPPQALTRGQAEVCGITQVVTPGLGVSAAQRPFRARLLNTPSITIVRLTGG